jgi:hypothetical protein
MSKQIFTKTTLPTGVEAVIYEGYGHHLFRALRLANGDTTQMAKYLLMQLLEVDGKSLTEEDVDNLHIRDAVFASEVIMSMMSNGIPGLRGF